MKILRTLLALFLAFPAAAQVRVVPTLQGSAAPAVTLFSAPAISAPSFASPLAPALTPSLLSAPAAPQAPVAAVPVAALPARTVLGLRDDADRLYAALANIHSRRPTRRPPPSTPSSAPCSSISTASSPAFPPPSFRKASRRAPA